MGEGYGGHRGGNHRVHSTVLLLSCLDSPGPCLDPPQAGSSGLSWPGRPAHTQPSGRSSTPQSQAMTVSVPWVSGTLVDPNCGFYSVMLVGHTRRIATCFGGFEFLLPLTGRMTLSR